MSVKTMLLNSSIDPFYWEALLTGVTMLSSRLGHFYAFTTVPGSQDGCDICANLNSHLFSNWFFDVAWDFTFFVTWPDARTLWMGCLSDTD